MREFQKNIFRTKTDEGVEAVLCYDISNPNIACVNCGTIIFDPFDHMVVRFGYNIPSNGKDLDIMVYFDNTGTPQDKDAVGYGQVPNNIKTPLNETPDGDAYLWWATDDWTAPDGPSVEAVVIGIKNFVSNVSTVGNILEIPLRVGWYNALSSSGDGNIAIELVTYSGGAMVKSGTTIVNTGGTVVQVQSTTKHIPQVGGTYGQVTEEHSVLVGTVEYNKTTKAAILVL